MNKLVVEKGQCIWVKWLDSATYGSGWVYDTIKAVPKEIETIGFVRDYKPKAVLLTSTQSNSGGCVSPIAIPLCAIVDYKIIEI